MRLMTSVLDRLLGSLSKDKGSRRNRSRERLMQQAIVETLEIRIMFGFGWDRGGEVPFDYPFCPTCSMQTPVVGSDSNDGSGGVPDTFSANPVSYIDGAINYQSADLVSTGMGPAWGIVRSWTGLDEASQLGNGWMIENLPYLVIERDEVAGAHTPVLALDLGGEAADYFDVSYGSTTITDRYNNQSHMTYVAPYSAGGVDYPGTFVLTDSSGDITTFYDVPRLGGSIYAFEGYAQEVTTQDSSTPYRFGAFKSYQDAAGNVTTATYDTNGNMTILQRVDASGAKEQFVFTYSTVSNSSGGSASLITNISMQSEASGSMIWNTIEDAQYQYYTGDDAGDAYGRLGDLKFVKIENDQGPTPATVDEKYYRYYKFMGSDADVMNDYGPTNGTLTTGGPSPYGNNTEGNFVTSGLRFTAEGDFYKSLSEAYGDLNTIQSLPESDVEPYAQNAYQSYARVEVSISGFAQVTRYEVTQELDAGGGCSACSDGFGTYTYSYTKNPDVNIESGDAAVDTNSWAMKTQVTLPDGNLEIVYTNTIGEVMMDVKVDTKGTETLDDDTVNITAYRYDTDGRLIETVNPSAINPFGWNSYPYGGDWGSFLTALEGYQEIDGGFSLLYGYSGQSGIRSEDKDSPFVSNESGLIQLNGYYTLSNASENTAGGVAGYQWFTAERQGEAEAPFEISGFSVSGTQATATFVLLPPDLLVGDSITIASTGASTQFNGTHTILSVDTNSWAITFAVTGSPTGFSESDGYSIAGLKEGSATDATKLITNMTISGTTVTLEADGHGYKNGDIVIVDGNRNYDSPIEGAFAIHDVTTNTFEITLNATCSAPDVLLYVYKPILLTETSYYQHVASDGTVVNPVATQTMFTNTDQTGVQTTTYTYGWQKAVNDTTSTSAQIGTITTTAPGISTDHNGPGTSNADVTITVLDNLGRTIWTKDADGYIDYTEYDPISGAVDRTITDVNTSITSNGYTNTLPSGWSSTANATAALNLIATYANDGLGRTIREVDPNGNISYTVYDDGDHATFSFIQQSLVTSGTVGTLTTAGPITMMRSQIPYTYLSANDTTVTFTSVYDETITFSGNVTGSYASGVFTPAIPGFISNGTDSPLFNLVGSGAASSPQFTIQSLTRTLYNVAGQVVETDAYPSISDSTSNGYLSTAPLSPYSGSTSNIYMTTYGYDDMGRQARVVSADGTITDTIYDGLGRAVATYIGTDDTPGTDYNGMGGINWEDFFYYVENNNGAVPGSTNMTLVVSNIYDFGVSGDGNLTSSTEYPGGSQAPRTTVYDYDWRDQLVATKAGVLPGLPSGFSDNNYGSPSITGTVSSDGSTFVVSGGGDGFEFDSNQFNFVSQTVSGDPAVLVTHVAQFSPNTFEAMGGLMLRDGTATGSGFAAVVETQFGPEFIWGTSGYYSYASSAYAPGESFWLKLTRSDNTFAGYYSVDGTDWTMLGSSPSLTLSSSLLGGLVVTTEEDDAIATARFNGFSINGTLVANAESDNTHRPIVVNALDNLGNVLSTSQYDGDGISMSDADGDGAPDALASNGSELRALSQNLYDEQDRVYRTITYSVDPTNGSYSTASSDTLISDTWYDHRGNVMATHSSGGTTTKNVHDGAGRLTISYTTDGGAVNNSGSILTGWSNAASVSSDIVLSQVEYTYDADGNVVMTTDRERFDSDSNGTDGTGALLSPADTGQHQARVSYVLNYYDTADRLIESINVGTNGGSLNGTANGGLNLTTFPSAPTASTADILATFYTYNAAGEMDSMTDPRGIVSKTYYDSLGRQTKTIADYVDGTPSNSDDQTTEYTYDDAGHVLTMTADMPAGTNDETTAYIYGGFDSGQLQSNDLLRLTEYPDKTAGTASTSSTDQVVMTYDNLGEPLTMRDQNLTLHTYEYDSLGRQTSDSVTFPFGNSQNVDTSVLRMETSYDGQGQQSALTSYSSATGGSGAVVNQIVNVYNGFGQLTRQYESDSGLVNTGTSSTTRSTQYGYSDAAHGSRLTSMTYPSGQVLSFSYGATNGLNDVVSRIASQGEGTITLESYTYMGLSTVVQRVQGSANTLTYIKQGAESNGDAGDKYTGLDRFGRVVDQRWVGSATTSTLQRLQYGYDQDSNILFVNNLKYQGSSQVYSYDNLNRLTSDQGGQINASDNGITSFQVTNDSWNYDALGNPISTSGMTGTTSTNTVNSQNQITDESQQADAVPPIMVDWFSDGSDSANWTKPGSGDAFSVNASGTGYLVMTAVSQDTINGHTEDDAREVLTWGDSLGPLSAYTSITFPTGATSGYAGFIVGYKSADDYWMDVIDISDNHRKIYHVIDGNKGSPVYDALHWEDVKDTLTASWWPTTVAIDGIDDTGGDVPSGNVGLVSSVAGVKFGYLKVEPMALHNSMAGTWDDYSLSNNNEGNFGATDPSTDELSLLPEGPTRPILLKNINLEKFQATFRFSGQSWATGNSSVDFVLAATDANQFYYLNLPHLTSSGAVVSFDSQYGNSNGFTLGGTTSVPSIATTDWRWVRITNDGTHLTVQFIDSNGSAPTETDWAGATTYFTVGLSGFSGFFGFMADGVSSVDDLVMKSYDNSNSSFDVAEVVDPFTVDGSGNASDTMTYDNNGNTTYDGEQAYTYDAWNRLVTVAHAYRDGTGVHSGQVFQTSSYDALGRRITKTICDGSYQDGTTVFYYSGDSIIETRNGDDRLLQQYVYAAAGAPNTLVGIGNVSDPPTETAWDGFYYVQQDVGGNVISVTDDTGTMVERYEYSAYGKRQVYYSSGSDDPDLMTPTIDSQEGNSQGDFFNEFGYQGLWTDDETGLIDNNERMLNPELGRFLQVDPIHSDGAQGYMSRGDNPVNYSDPTGLYNANGHFYTTYLVALAAGYDANTAYTLAYYSQLPDEINGYNAATQGAQYLLDFSGTSQEALWANDVEQILHSLHNGGPSQIQKRRECLSDLVASGELDPWQQGFVIHALGDAYAHTYIDAAGHEKAYGFPWGHTFDFEGPDTIGTNPAKYGEFVDTLFSSLLPLSPIYSDGTPDYGLIDEIKRMAVGFKAAGFSISQENDALRALALKHDPTGRIGAYTPTDIPYQSYLTGNGALDGALATPTKLQVAKLMYIIAQHCGCFKISHMIGYEDPMYSPLH